MQLYFVILYLLNFILILKLLICKTWNLCSRESSSKNFDIKYVLQDFYKPVYKIKKLLNA